MNSQVHQALKNVSWHCFKCGVPNFSSGLFENSSLSFDSLFNPFATLDPRCCSPEPNPIFDPLTPTKEPAPVLTSTPNPPSKGKFSKNSHIPQLKTLIINFQSLWNKRTELSTLAKDTGCDIIIGTETWLTPEIKNSELNLDDFDIHRKDRPNRGGGGS